LLSGQNKSKAGGKSEKSKKVLELGNVLNYKKKIKKEK